MRVSYKFFLLFYKFLIIITSTSYTSGHIDKCLGVLLVVFGFDNFGLVFVNTIRPTIVSWAHLCWVFFSYVWVSET